MNVLVACEESQVVCTAFRARGHNAYSCDLQVCSSFHTEWHIVEDVSRLLDGRCSFRTFDGVLHFLDGRWDLIIAHPPCTYLSNAGACRLYPRSGELDLFRFYLGLQGREFFMSCLHADCDRVCVENPVPSKVFDLPKPSQIIQPYEFGHPFSKKTCLWLRGLPCLVPTLYVPEHSQFTNYVKSAKKRSRTFSGIAFAMASQWG